MFLFQNGPNPASSYLFSFFSQRNDEYSTIYDYNSLDGVFGIQTRDSKMEGADESTELWRPSISICY